MDLLLDRSLDLLLDEIPDLILESAGRVATDQGFRNVCSQDPQPLQDCSFEQLGPELVDVWDSCLFVVVTKRCAASSLEIHPYLKLQRP